MTGYQIALFVRPDVVTPEIRQAWQREGCELIVRSDYPPLEEVANQRYAGRFWISSCRRATCSICPNS